jgi:hypothetical protein
MRYLGREFTVTLWDGTTTVVEADEVEPSWTHFGTSFYEIVQNEGARRVAMITEYKKIEMTDPGVAQW